MSAKNSHLTIRKDLFEENLSVPVRFLDYQEESWITDSDTLNICLLYTSPSPRDRG